MTANTNAASVPGPEDQKFNAWYESKFKPAMERGPLDKYVARQAWFAAISTAAQQPAGIWVPTELAERVQETMGEFLMDHGWRQQDMDTSDEFGALLAAAPKHHVQIPSENIHIDSDVSRKSEKIDTSQPADEREAFEAHFSKPPFEWEFHRYGEWSAWPGNYQLYEHQCAWEAWQARAKLGAAQQPAGWVMEAHQLADALPIAGKNEDVYRWALDAASLLNKLRALKTEREPLTERQIVKCLQESSCIGTVKMSFESGPYDIDRPSINATRLVGAIEREHGIQPAHKEQPDE